MTARGPFAFAVWLLAIGALATLFVPGCSEDGLTGTCPELSLYDINLAGERNSPKVVDERNRSVDAGCMSPLGDASTSTAGAAP